MSLAWVTVERESTALARVEHQRQMPMHTQTHRAVTRYLQDRRTSQGIRLQTAADYTYILHAFADHCPANPAKINRRCIRKWLDAQTCSPATLRTRLSAVRTFCDWLVAEDYISRSPVRNDEPPGAHRTSSASPARSAKPI